MACLDTSFIIDVIRGRTEALSFVQELEKSEKHLTIATPSIMEIWFGATRNNSAKEKLRIQEFIDNNEILVFDQNAAKEAAEIECDLIKRGEMIEIEDIQIAACAKVNGQIIVTKDNGFTKIPGLRVLKY